MDSAPTGAAMRLLGAPDLEQWYARNLAGLTSGAARLLLPSLSKALKLSLSESIVQLQLQGLFDRIGELRGALTDREQTSVRLVLNPDQLSVQETQRAFTYMSLFGLSVDSLYVNRILPSAIRDPFFEALEGGSGRSHRDCAERVCPAARLRGGAETPRGRRQ